MTRSSPGQVRRAAGSKDPTALPKAIEGWTCQELDGMEGKSALHMAAWQGCLENIELLLELGCNVNVIATGTYSYGKTPIFFAATRCRDDVVQYLLQQNASVKIVNNKGQSVLSIASSHLSPETIRAIQKAESNDEEWINYRVTHSDGLEYGDLDPRFLDRPLRNTDVVTKLAVNPTTRESRRGAFARRNPHAAKELERRTAKQSRRRRKTKPPTHQEIAQQNQVWESMATDLALNEYSGIGSKMLSIVRFEERQRRSWIPAAAERLRGHLSDNVDRIEDAVRSFIKQDSNCMQREALLLQKWIEQVGTEPTNETQNSVHSEQRSKLCVTPIDLSLSPWRTARQAAHGLSPLIVQNSERNCHHLSLPEPPEWINTLQGLNQVRGCLRNCARNSASSLLVALDTEWCTDKDNGTIHVSTIQIAVVTQKEENHKLHTWIVDLLQANTPGVYQDEARGLLKWLFDEASNVTTLGFAFAHDVAKLHAVCDSLSWAEYLDVQRLAAQQMNLSKKVLPGLQACTQFFVCRDSPFVLSKQEQCSDWSRRPLTNAQLEYAGLDAAILLVLLAQIASESNNDSVK